MTAAAYATNLVTIIADTQTASATGWTALGGGGAALNPGSTELFIQNAQAMTKDAFGVARKGMIYDTGADQGGSGTDGAYSFWCTFTSVPSLDTKAGAGFDVLIGSSTSDYEHYHVFGRDTFVYGGWFFAAVNEATAGDETTGTPSATVEQTFGVLADATVTGAPSKGETIGIDAVREGRHDIVITGGTTPDAAATFDGIMSNLETSTNRYGMLVQKEPGGPFENSGKIAFGTSGSAVRFTDSNKVFFLRDHDHVTTNFHSWEVSNASSEVNLTNITVKALGTTSPGRWLSVNDATVNLTTCTFIDMGTFNFNPKATVDACTFLNCGRVAPAGGNMSNSSVLESGVAANAGAVFYNETTDPDTDMDGVIFSQGTNAHHAVHFGTSVPATMTLRNCEFNGFSGTDDQNGSTFRFDDTSGTITLNLIGCTVDGSVATAANIGIDTRISLGGLTVNLVIDPVDVTVNVKDENGIDLQSARVYLKASDGTGPLPYQDSVTAARVGTTVTVTHSSHGMETGDKVSIKGITNATEDNNGVRTITVTGASAYTFTSSGSGNLTYTGTITSTWVALEELTTIAGVATVSKTFASAQPVDGWVRKSTTSVRYKSFPIAGTISATAGLEINVQMIPDE